MAVPIFTLYNCSSGAAAVGHNPSTVSEMDTWFENAIELNTIKWYAVAKYWGDNVKMIPGTSQYDNIGGIIQYDLNIVEAGEYSFKIWSDDFGDVFIGGAICSYSPTTDINDSVVYPITLDVGHHTLRVRYQNGGGPSHYRLFWKPPGASDYRYVDYTAVGIPDLFLQGYTSSLVEAPSFSPNWQLGGITTKNGQPVIRRLQVWDSRNGNHIRSVQTEPDGTFLLTHFQKQDITNPYYVLCFDDAGDDPSTIIDNLFLVDENGEVANG